MNRSHPLSVWTGPIQHIWCEDILRAVELDLKRTYFLIQTDISHFHKPVSVHIIQGCTFNIVFYMAIQALGPPLSPPTTQTSRTEWRLIGTWRIRTKWIQETCGNTQPCQPKLLIMIYNEHMNRGCAIPSAVYLQFLVLHPLQCCVSKSHFLLLSGWFRF